MSSLVSLALCILFAWGIVALSPLADEIAFKEFVGKYGKSYAHDDEYNFRLKVFKQNKAFIEQHNSNPARTYDVAMNNFGDLTHEEYVAKLVGKPFSACFGQDGPEEVAAPIPANLDWRSTGNVAPVQNEGECGSVSYVNVANQVSSVLSIAVNKPPVPLSTQQMMDCYSSGNDNGCNGGDPWNLYTYIEKAGLEPASAYPYQGANSTGKCHYKQSQTVASITGSGNVTSEVSMQSAVATYGPVIALFDASAQGFSFYSSGIYSSTQCSASQLDHVLLVVGYGVTSNNTDYWIAQNVWGPDWGMNGYVNVLRGVDMCGISTCSSYVTGAHAIKH